MIVDGQVQGGTAQGIGTCLLEAVSFDAHGQPLASTMLDYLLDHVQRPEFQCRFRWQPHSIAFWDNRSVQHSAIWDYFPKVRSGYRVTVAGQKPIAA